MSQSERHDRYAVLSATSVVVVDYEYRTRANNGRSQLVAAPLSSQAKMHFLLAFYVTI